MGHWYSSDGTPHHTYVNSKGETKDTTLTQARKLNLYPSVTGVLEVKSNFHLTNWKVRVGIEYALGAIRHANEDMQDFVDRIAYESVQKSRDATEFGTEMHDTLERWNVDHSYVCPPEKPALIREILENWKRTSEQYGIRVLSAERRIACPQLGIAGTVDLIAEYDGLGLTVGDYKSQDIKEYKGKRDANFYDKFAHQLALYARMVKIVDGLSEDPRIVSHVIDSNDGTIYTKVYTPEQQNNALVMGLTLAKAWFFDKGYFPVGLDFNELHWMP